MQLLLLTCERCGCGFFCNPRLPQKKCLSCRFVPLDPEGCM